MRIIPKLKEDMQWHITSPADSNYNCVAWVFRKKDFNIWPDVEDGEKQYYNQYGGSVRWPSQYADNAKLETFTQFFNDIGFIDCEMNWSNELGYNKIALYSIDNVNMSHVSFEGNNNLWCSKLGRTYDIVHSNPFSIECDIYGHVVKIMKAKLQTR